MILWFLSFLVILETVWFNNGLSIFLLFGHDPMKMPSPKLLMSPNRECNSSGDERLKSHEANSRKGVVGNSDTTTPKPTH